MPDVVTDYSNAGGFKRVQNSMWRAFHALEVAQHGIDEAWEALENMKEHIDFELWRCESEEKLARAVATPTPLTSPPAVQPPPGNFGIPLCRLTIPVKPPSPRCHCPHCSNGMSLTWGIPSIADMGRATEQPSLLAIEDSQPQNSKDIIPPMPKRPCPRAETSLSQSTATEHVHPSSPSCDPTEIFRSQSTATEHADPSSPSCDLSEQEQFLDCLES